MTINRILGTLGVAALLATACAPAARAEGEHAKEAREKRVATAAHPRAMMHHRMTHHRMMHHRAM